MGYVLLPQETKKAIYAISSVFCCTHRCHLYVKMMTARDSKFEQGNWYRKGVHIEPYKKLV